MPSDEALKIVRELKDQGYMAHFFLIPVAEIIDRHMPKRDEDRELAEQGLTDWSRGLDAEDVTDWRPGDPVKKPSDLAALLVEAAEMIERVCASGRTAGTPLALAAGNLIGRLHKAAEEIK